MILNALKVMAYTIFYDAYAKIFKAFSTNFYFRAVKSIVHNWDFAGGYRKAWSYANRV